MRLGKVVVNMGYVVDLDNENMVESAKEALYEELMTAHKYNGVANWIGVITDGEGLSESDIPEFLIEEMEEMEN